MVLYKKAMAISTGGLADAPDNDKIYARKNKEWLEIDLTPTGNQYINGRVATFGDLPLATENENSIYIVETATGIAFINRKKAGMYHSDGITWNFMPQSVQANFVLYDNTSSSLVNTDVQGAIDELKTISDSDAYERVDLNAAGTYNLTSVAKKVYACVLTNGNIVINLPTPTSETEGENIIIYIEVASPGNTVTINGTIRGQSSFVMEKQYDSVKLVAHILSTPHYDIVQNNRTDNIIYNPGNLGTESINNLQELLGYELSPSVITGCTVTNNAGIVTVAAGEVLLFDEASTKNVRLFKFDGGTYNIPVNTLRYLTLFNNNGVVELRDFNSLFSITDRRNTVIATVYRGATTHVDILMSLDYSTNFAVRYYQVEAVRNWLKRDVGLGISSTSTTSINITAGVVSNSIIQNNIPQLIMDATTSATWTYFNGASWIETDRNTIDNVNYNDITTGLTPMANTNRFASHWVYVLVNNPSRMIVVYSQQEYADEASAINAAPPSDSNLPVYLRNYGLGILVGKVVIAKSSTTSTAYTAFSSVFNTGSAGALTDHNSLISLQGGVTNEYYHLTLAQHTSTIREATATQNGLMSSSYASKLDGIAINANNYIHPVNHPWSILTGTPTTLSGYGITDAMTVGTSQTITGTKEFTTAVNMLQVNYVRAANNVWSVGKLENSNSFFISQVGSSAGAFYVYTNPSAAFASRFEILAGKITAPVSDYVNGDSVLNAASSDARYELKQVSALKYKENVVDFSDTSILDQIRIVQYDMKDGSEQDVVGIIADELELVAPEICRYVDSELDGYDVRRLVPYLIAEIQKLKARINTLEGK